MRGGIATPPLTKLKIPRISAKFIHFLFASPDMAPEGNSAIIILSGSTFYTIALRYAPISQYSEP